MATHCEICGKKLNDDIAEAGVRYTCFDCWRGGSAPRDTKEDDVSVEFTEEEAEDQKRFISELHSEGVINLWHYCSMKDYIDAHTKKPLTFPCPACGAEMAVCVGGEWVREIEENYIYGACVECKLKTWPYETEAELSEALNKEA